MLTKMFAPCVNGMAGRHSSLPCWSMVAHRCATHQVTVAIPYDPDEFVQAAVSIPHLFDSMTSIDDDLVTNVFWIFQNSLDWGQSRKNKFSKLSGSGLKKI